MTDKLTIKKARAIMKGLAIYKGFVDTTHDPHGIAMAKGVISGYDQGVRAAAEVVIGPESLVEEILNLISDNDQRKLISKEEENE